MEEVVQEISVYAGTGGGGGRWVPAIEAAALSGEPELVPVLQHFADHPPADDVVVPVPDKSPWQWLVDMFR